MIIESLLDTDLYKFTMQQVVLHHFPGASAEFDFKLRNYPKGALLPYKDEIIKEVKHLCTLGFTYDELEYLRTLRFLKDDYIEYLRNFKLNMHNIKIFEEDGELKIHIGGSWLSTILFEVPVLAIVSEVYFRDKTDHYGQAFLEEKIEYIKYSGEHGVDIKFADFGTRRRYSKLWQMNVLCHLVKELPKNFVGTSNVMFAKMFRIKPIGTMAHEFIQATQSMVRLIDSQKYAFEKWVEEYRGDLGIALSDTLGMKAFFNDFDLYFSKLYDGARHDSGDPYEWCEKLIMHYESMGIDPTTKMAVFSDGLDFIKAEKLMKKFGERIKVSFGIGTHLTNDMGLTHKPLQIVIKMTACNGQPVAKISDSPGKAMCNDEDYLKYLRSVFGIDEVIG